MIVAAIAEVRPHTCETRGSTVRIEHDDPNAMVFLIARDLADLLNTRFADGDDVFISVNASEIPTT